MARPLRLNYDGAVYHVTARGNARGDVFFTDRDRERYLYSLEESIERYGARLYLFCLMTNHVHLVLETPRGNLSALMQRLNTAYTVWFNRMHRRSGHLFQGRYRASVVEEDGYILKLSRYVHLNPVFVVEHKAKSVRERVDILRSYIWSSYASYIGLRKRFPFVTYGSVLTMMGRSKKQQMSTYRRFVEGGISDIDSAFIADKQASCLCIGSADCRENIVARYDRLADDNPHEEDLYFQREEACYTVGRVLAALSEVFDMEQEEMLARRRDSWLRALACRSLQVYCRLPQRAIGQTLGIGSGAAVSKQLRLLAEEMKHSNDLQFWWEQIKWKLG